VRNARESMILVKERSEEAGLGQLIMLRQSKGNGESILKEKDTDDMTRKPGGWGRDGPEQAK